MTTIKTYLQQTLALTAALTLGLPHTALAQSITAAPDGTGTIIHYNGNTYHITGGTHAGANLFHSFQQFGLQPSEIANFLSNPAIQNVVGRVIGGNPSVIEGLIRLSGGNSNLFLVNPAGWIFTEGASVDVPGSFGVTTANRIGFGAGFFNATGENDYTALTGDPTSLIFDSSQPGAIINAADLNVANGSLWMVGGSVISTGSITAENGTVTLAAVPGESKVKLSHDGMKLSFFLDALALDEVAPGTPLGIRVVDLPSFLNSSHEVGSANEIVRAENGELWLVGSRLRVEDGDVVIGSRVTAENVDLVAAGRVQVADPSEIAGTTTVVRLPEADGPVSLNVIDRHADNADSLLYGSAAGTISRIVENDEDGIAVITEQLAEIRDQGEQLDGMSITAEGNEGNFWLGNTWINHENIAIYQDQLNQWADAFTESADLLLYSCFTALGEVGEGFVQTLATATGLDVAASTNATGSANHSGDWALEYRTGAIELGNPFTDATLSVWEGKLATFTVTTATQAALDAAIGSANGSAGADEIRFSGVTQIDLTSALSDITGELTITGGDTRVTIAGNSTNFRIFNVTGGVATTFDNLTITGGRVTGDGGGIRSNGAVTVTNSTISSNSASGRGGGVYSNGAVTITNSTISGNSANNHSGGIRSNGAVTVTNSTVSGNVANSSIGGGIGNASTSAVTVTNSTISGNSSGNDGGGIFSNGAVTVNSSTVSGNSANRVGGGISGDGAVTVNSSTISGNSASNFGGGIRGNGGVTVNSSTISGNSSGSNGGGIRSNGAVTVTNSTISSNSASDVGGGIGNASTSAVTVTNSTISGNSSGNDGGGVFGNGAVSVTNSTISGNSANRVGGGVRSDGAVSVTSSTVSGNSSGDRGGGIGNASTSAVTVTNSTISGNSSGRDGGGIFGNGAVTVTTSTISGNSANDDSGGLRSDGAVTVTNSTISGNSARDGGGGIGNASTSAVTITNSTISGNSANDGGGGIYSNGAVIATNATIAFNSGGDGGGIYAVLASSLGNTIVANNRASGNGPDLVGTFTANYSLILDPSGATIGGGNNIFNQDPLLQPLADNGGPTQTHAITAASPALNAGSNSIANLAGLTTDQRGLAARIFGGTVDIGAYELNPNADVGPFTFAELYLDPLEETEELIDGFMRGNACQTVPELDLGQDSIPIEEDLDATDNIELDDNCLPINDKDESERSEISAVQWFLNHVAWRE
ncbi:MAG: DUF4347 domain-containing protein [Spirulina sp. SIO3F2]|nr:DUF4347 domain-containing protein [Spirulina sp. SIO3F2]